MKKKREARTIEDVIKLRKELKARSLADKLAKETAQFNLREIYKPIIEGQKQQTLSQKETSEEQLRQQRQLQGVKSQEEQQRHDLLIEEIKKQPLVIPLIKSLNKQTNVVKVIKGESDGSALTGKEQHILQQVNKVVDRVLRTLIDFYSVPLTTIEKTMSESGIGTSEFLPSTEELTKSKLEMSELLRKQEEEGKNLYDYLIGLQTYTDRQRILQDTKWVFTKRENKDSFI